MTNYELRAFGADRIVIAIQNSKLHKKIFQINLKSRDGSIFASIPYAKLGAGRLGVVHCPSGSPDSLIFGEDAPFTTHSIKYTHHPDGAAHFSQDGKIFTKIRKNAVPLTAAGGHLFTIMVQGLHHFKDIDRKDISTQERGVVSMPVADGDIEALEFAAHLHSSVDFAKSLKYPVMDSELIACESPDGQRRVGAVIATRLFQTGRPYLLIVTVEAIQAVAAHTDLFACLMGGFDPPDVALNHDRSTSFLMMMYPEQGDLATLLQSVGSVDFSSRKG